MIKDIALQGAWDFALDPDRKGLSEDWHKTRFEDEITLPGTIDLARKCPPGPSAGMAYLTRRNPYVGPAWYARDVVVPEDHDGLYHDLFLERPHGAVRVWLDGLEVGRDLGLCTPNTFLLGQLAPGLHRLVIRIDNGDFPQVGGAHQDTNSDVAHSTSEHTQSNWNGIVGALRIEARAARIARLDVSPQDSGIDIAVELDALDPNRYWPGFWTSGTPNDELRLTATLADGRTVARSLPVTIDSAHTPLAVQLTLPEDTPQWDEFSPVVHALRAEWWRDGTCLDRRDTSFGLRRIMTEGRHILINGRRIFLRGTLDCALFPKTGHPPMDHDGWRAIFEMVKANGLNHVRFHSWCPPRAAFDVADALGLYLHVETPVWCVLGSDPGLDQLVRHEAERIVAHYGNHPSFVMLTVGNEVAGPGLHAWLERFLDHWRRTDVRRIYSGGSGWPALKRADYLSKPEPRSHRWGEGLDSRLNARPLETMTDWSDWVQKQPQPLLGHEIGQWCAYPDLDTIADFDGPLANHAFEQVAEDLTRKGQRHSARDKVICSGMLQTALYKEDIEASLRTPDYAGFQLLGLQDFSGQGTALVGVVDAFWQSKPYHEPSRFAQFCGPVVPLIRAAGFVLNIGDRFEARAELSCFGPEDLSADKAEWRLTDHGGQIHASGRLPHGQLATGALHVLGQISIETAELAQGQYCLQLSAGGGTNAWDLWVFDRGVADLPIVTSLGPDELRRLDVGETLVFCPNPDQVAPNAALGHTTIFWNTVWTGGQPPTTLGLINRLDHPLFRHFPAGRASGWHQWELTHQRRALDMRGLEVTRIIDVIDDWNTNRDLALLAEARVGKGRLVFCAVDMTTGNGPVAAALRRALHAVIAAPHGDCATISPAELRNWADAALIQEARPT